MLQGLSVPVPTIFDAEGRLDSGRSGAFVRAIASAGADHVYVLASHGEFALLEEAERRTLLEASIESLTGKADAWVGVGAPSTRVAVRYAEAAEEAGAAAIVAVPPYYVRPTMEALAHYYRALRDATKVPLLAQNFPNIVGYSLSPELVHRLGRDRVLDGVVDVSGFLEGVVDFLAGGVDGFSVLSGDESLALAALEKGASGVVLGSANVVPKLGVALLRAARSHEAARAAELQLLVSRLAEAIGTGPFPSTTKFLARETWGAPDGYRAPSEALTPSEERTVRAAFDPLRPLLRPYL